MHTPPNNELDILLWVTVLGAPTSPILTTRGEVTFAEWIESERRRIVRRTGLPAVVYTHPKTGEIALAYLRTKHAKEQVAA